MTAVDSPEYRLGDSVYWGERVRMRVLLVEDTRDVAEAIVIQLERAGMACDRAGVWTRRAVSSTCRAMT